MDYLRDKKYYEDRYDILTIEECLEQIEIVHKVNQKTKLAPELKNYPESEIKRNMNLFLGRLLFLIKANRYKNRASTISKWIDEDKSKQDKLDNTPPPEIICPDCDTQMVADDFRDLRDWPENEPLRVLYIFNCPKCKKRLGAYDNGEIHKSKFDLSLKCKKELTITNKRKDKVITTFYKCKNCSYSKKEVFDLKKHDEEHKKWEEDQKKKEEANNKLLEKYRKEFCLSDKEGKEYVDCLEAMEVANEVYDEALAEFDNPAQEKLMTLKKIEIVDLEKLLNKALASSDFGALSLGSPDIDRYVLVPFTIQEKNSKRHGSESIYDLYDLFKKTLENTNWRAPKDSFSYRLGFIKGTLKGYESEEDLLKLVGKEKPLKPKPKVDPKLREKHNHHNYVQLARMSGEFEAKRRMRKRRLKDEPDGFFLNDGGRGYRCGICGESHGGEDIWWREDGLRCRDCWQNIKEGVIPKFDLSKEWWEEEFLGRYEITSKHGVHPSSIKRLRREGVLVGRDLKDSSGNVYCTVYLVEENKEFLRKHPKKESKLKMTITGKDGKTIQL